MDHEVNRCLACADKPTAYTEAHSFWCGICGNAQNVHVEEPSYKYVEIHHDRRFLNRYAGGKELNVIDEWAREGDLINESMTPDMFPHWYLVQYRDFDAIYLVPFDLGYWTMGAGWY